MDTSCFHILIIINNAIVNMRYNIFWVRVFVFFTDEYTVSGIDVLYGSSKFERTSITVLHKCLNFPLYISTNNAKYFIFFISQPTGFISCLRDMSHSNRFHTWFLMVVWIYISWWIVMFNTFSCMCWLPVWLLWKKRKKNVFSDPFSHLRNFNCCIFAVAL